MNPVRVSMATPRTGSWKPASSLGDNLFPEPHPEQYVLTLPFLLVNLAGIGGYDSTNAGHSPLVEI